jgi:phage shock protein E
MSRSITTPARRRNFSISVAAIALMITFGGCHAKKEPAAAETPAVPPGSTQHVNAGEAQKLVEEKKAKVLDVRTPDEFASGHIAGAINIDFHGTDFEQKIAALDKATPYLVHCHSGRRSQEALPVLQKEGLKYLYHLDGGIEAWEQAGLPVEK